MSILFLTQELPPRLGRDDGLLAAVLTAWFGVALGVALSGLAAAGSLASIGLFATLIFGPIGLFTLAAIMSPALRGWALALDQRLLIGIHALRTIGLSFVFLYVYDLLPAAFAFPAGLGDAATAVWAVWLSFSLSRGEQVDDARIARWNWFGAADFLVAVGIGLAFQSALYGGEVNTDAMATFPLVLIPLFGVPVLAISHIIIAMQLHARRKV